LHRSIRDNLTLAVPSRISRFGVIRANARDELVRTLVRRLQIKVGGTTVPAAPNG